MYKFKDWWFELRMLLPARQGDFVHLVIKQELTERKLAAVVRILDIKNIDQVSEELRQEKLKGA